MAHLRHFHPSPWRVDHKEDLSAKFLWDSIRTLSLIILGLALVAGIARAETVKEPNVSEQRVLVKWKSSPLLTAQSLTQLASTNDIQELGALSVVLRHSSFDVIRFSSEISAIEAARRLRANPAVEWAQPDYRTESVGPSMIDRDDAELFSLTAKPGLSDAPALPNPPQDDPDLSKLWNVEAISLRDAWRNAKGDKKTLVAVLDTGIDYTHEDLVNNVWRLPSGGTTTIGYDFVHNDPMPFDDHGHGTHCSGVIGATGGNGIGIAGVNHNVSIMGLKFIAKEGSGSTEAAIRAIDFAIKHGAKVMSNSWGMPEASAPAEENRLLREAVKRASDAGILFIVAAGNDGTNNDEKSFIPATINEPTVITVSSTSKIDNNPEKKSFFSNYGVKSVHVGAPGSNIISTFPGEKKYFLSLGTSMAAPHVAGLAALVMSKRPDLSPLQVRQVILNSVDPMPTLQGKVQTGGRVNAARAIEEAMKL